MLLESSGEITPPWGEPLSGCVTLPSSMTPAFNQARIRRRTLTSPTRRPTNCISSRLSRRTPGPSVAKIGDSSSLRQLALNLAGDGLRHLALQYQDVAQIALVLLGPKAPVITSPDQLRRDPH